MTLESYILDYIEGRRRNFFIRGALYGASLIFGLGCKVRHFFYDYGLFKSYTVTAPVLSVGNITAGGTGKTPFVQLLAEKLSSERSSIAIITRGYRSKQKKRKVLQISKGKGPILSIEESGDEPYWLAKNTKASVWVSKDRVASAKLAIEGGADFLILEDGLQHRRLKRDVEVVLLHGADLFGKGVFLPRGYLRDFPERLQKADLIVVTHVEEGISEEEIIKQIRVFSKAPVVGFCAEYSLKENIEGKKIGAFCGIAKPEFFYKALESIGGELVHRLTSKDHELPSQEVFQNFINECRKKQVTCLICTEKDEVKLKAEYVGDLPIFVLKMSFICVWNKKIWQEWCQSMLSRK